MNWATAMVAAASLLAVGCSRSAAPDTGARQVAQHYLDAFCRQDWAGAYQALDAQTRTRFDARQFTAWASGYRARLGFDVETSVVHSCEEVGDQAIANATLGGHKENRQVTKNTAAMLHRGESGWRVVLPASERAE